MKTIFGWLCDPYVHVIGIVLIMARLAVPAGDERVEATRRLVHCTHCLHIHEDWGGICRVSAVNSHPDPNE
jgi:hypothetical protein